MDKKDPPIQEQEFLSGMKVVDIGDIRVSRGMSRRPHSTCRHLNLVYDSQERRIWCKDCENNIDAFDAFKQLAENYDSALRHSKKIHADALAARDHHLHLIAAKNLEEMWRRRRVVPACPHCKRGLLPEDFKTTGTLISAAIERQRRENEKKTPPKPQGA